MDNHKQVKIITHLKIIITFLRPKEIINNFDLRNLLIMKLH